MRVGSKGRKSESPPTETRVAIYTRKSVAEGLDQEFNSLDAQREAVEAYILSQRSKGWKAIPEQYDDGGFTGANTNRPAFQRLLKDVETGKIDVICAYKIDRLSRSISDFTGIMDFLEKHGVQFVSVTQSFDTSTSMGKLTMNILVSFGQYEREMISERTRDKMAASRRKGIYTGGRPLLGYDSIDKKLVINEAEAAQVRTMFRIYRERGSLLAVANELNRRGWTTKRYETKNGKLREGKVFTKTHVHRLLTTTTYTGKVLFEGETYDGEHDAIIPEDEFNAVQDMLESHRRANRRNRTKWPVILAGLVRCDVCGSAFTHSYTSKRGRRFHYYVCSSAIKNGAATCPKSRISMKKLEDHVIDKIRGIGECPELLRETATALKTERVRRVPELRSEKQHLEKERARLRGDRREQLRRIESDEAGVDGVSLLKEHEERLERIKARLDEVRVDLDALEAHESDEDELRAALSSFLPIWDCLFPRERERVLQLLIESISFNGPEQTVEIQFRPGGVWKLAEEYSEVVA